MEYVNYFQNNKNFLNADEDDNIAEDVILLKNLENNWSCKENLNIPCQNDIPNHISEQNTLNLSNNNQISINSTVNTNAEFGDGSQNINNIESFLSFGQPQIKTKKELTQKSIGILQNFIIKEKNNVNNKIILDIKDIKLLKNNINIIEDNLDLYFKRPHINKNYKKISKIKSTVNDDEKVSFNEKLSIDDSKNKKNINVIKNLNSFINEDYDIEINNENK